MSVDVWLCAAALSIAVPSYLGSDGISTTAEEATVGNRALGKTTWHWVW